MPQISVIIPIYKAQSCLQELYLRLKQSLEMVTDNFEIIMVEDCGGDRSWEIINELAINDDRVIGIQHSRNFGQHAATICGISQASGDWIITIDDDLEHQPEDIPALLNRAQEGYTIVYGIYPKRTHAKWRNITSDIVRYLFRLAIPSLNYEYTSFRVIKNNIAKKICDFDSPFPFIDGYLSWLSADCASVEVAHSHRASGQSTYTFKKLLTHTINIFVTFSDLPLKLSSWIGLGTFLVGMFLVVGIVLSKLLGGITVSGFTSLMAATLLFGGTQLLILGIFGEYLGRINFKSSKKPLFIIGKTTRKQKV